MKIKPHGNNILCKASPKETHKTSSGIIYENDDLLTYEVLAIGNGVASDNQLDLHVGDEVIVNSTGTLVDDGSNKLYIFNIDNIEGKIQ